MSSNTYLMRCDGPTDSAYLGYDNLGGTGDVNGDGKADFVAGSDSLSYNGRAGSGAAFVVFGQASQNTIDSSALGGNGYRIDGPSANDSAGNKVGNAGAGYGEGKYEPRGPGI